MAAEASAPSSLLVRVDGLARTVDLLRQTVAERMADHSEEVSRSLDVLAREMADFRALHQRALREIADAVTGQERRLEEMRRLLSASSAPAPAEPAAEVPVETAAPLPDAAAAISKLGEQIDSLSGQVEALRRRMALRAGDPPPAAPARAAAAGTTRRRVTVAADAPVGARSTRRKATKDS